MRGPEAAMVPKGTVQPFVNTSNNQDYVQIPPWEQGEAYSKHVVGGIPCNARKTMLRVYNENLKQIPHTKLLQDALAKAQSQNSKVRFEVILDLARSTSTNLAWSLYCDTRTRLAIQKNTDTIEKLSRLVDKNTEKLKEIAEERKRLQRVWLDGDPVSKVLEDDSKRVNDLNKIFLELVARIVQWMEVSQDDIDHEVTVYALESDQ